ncbi:MAG: DNA (cytosine-5-)-methyltransferase [archaeon]
MGIKVEQVTAEVNAGNPNEKEAIELIEKVRDRIRSTNSQFYEIVNDLRIIRDKKYYSLIKNTKTNEPFSNFEEFCLFYYELSRTTIFNYMQALEYLEKHHPECVHACEPVEHRKINLLATLDNDKFQNERIELDNKVFNQKISYRDLEVEIKQLKEKSFEIDLKKVQAFDKNIHYLSDTYEEYGDTKILCVEKYNDKIRIHYDSYSTLTTQSLLFHIDGREFSLREYAGVQDFPDDFNFVGNYSEIKKQLGNAVDVKMAEAVIKKFIKGNSYIELFCGCGGFSQGAHNKGKRCLWANDSNKYAAYSFKLNFPETDVCISDIKKIDEKEIYEKIGKIDFILAGCPCQGFSLSGNKFGFECDERNGLYLELIRFLSFFKPSQFVMENVPPILEYKDRIIEDFKNAGYDIKIEKINGLEIGSKQSRTRVFFIGDRREK